MKNIKNILVPTDFSVTARNAFQYAKTLAAITDAQITVVHIEQLLVMDISVVRHPQATERLNEAMENFIADETEDSPTMVQTKVKTKILIGHPATRLVELSEQYGVDLMVMGTTGLQDFSAKIMGSTSLEVANKAHCPILLVPRDAKWKPIHKIMFSTTYESALPKIVYEVADFANHFKAKVDFVHVEHAKSVQNIDRLFEELFAEVDAGFPFDIHTVQNNDIVAGLRQYSEENGIDLMVFVSKHRSFWQNLIHHSISLNMALTTNKPMLIMHFDDKETRQKLSHL
jgi:nucleotide-binding universal stress UspA family protein